MQMGTERVKVTLTKVGEHTLKIYIGSKLLFIWNSKEIVFLMYMVEVNGKS